MGTYGVRQFRGYQTAELVDSDRRAEKPLYISTSPAANADQAELTLALGNREIGTLTVHPEDFADFIEALRLGFRLIINQRPQVHQRSCGN